MSLVNLSFDDLRHTRFSGQRLRSKWNWLNFLITSGNLGTSESEITQSIESQVSDKQVLDSGRELSEAEDEEWEVSMLNCFEGNLPRVGFE